MVSRTSIDTIRRCLPGFAILLCVALLTGAPAAYAFFREARPPDQPYHVGQMGGCYPSCSGYCSYNMYENGDVCRTTSCACCGCETFQAQLNYWLVSAGNCVPGSYCACIGGDEIWMGYYTGSSARTTADCG